MKLYQDKDKLIQLLDLKVKKHFIFETNRTNMKEFAFFDDVIASLTP